MNLYNTGVTVELDELIRAGIKVWDFEYPSFYKDEKKAAFEQLVLDHYRFRQIGQETPGRWLHCFRTRVREIMPYYVELYKSVELMASVEDPFKAYDLTETYREERLNEGSSESSGSKTVELNTHHIHSATPQGNIENLETHMSDASKEGGSNTETDGGSMSSENKGSMEYTLTRQGNIGVQPLGQEIEAYRKALINVDMMVIEDLNDLFLKVY